jgi:ribosome maturation factor RimP
VARALALNLVDVVTDWQEGSELLADLLDQPGAEELDEVAGASTGVERLLVGQGLGPGGPWAG